MSPPSSRPLWDITPPLRPEMPVWPGDTPFAQVRTWSLGPACPVNVSRVTLSTHAGAHADAPLHYDPQGLPIGEVDLLPYLGPCLLVDVAAAGPVVEATHLEAAWQAGTVRLLLRTGIGGPADAWTPDFPSVSAAAIHWMAERGVILVGVDTPSLDPPESKSLEAHHAVRQRRMAILEGLALDHVPAGPYELIALPLRFADLDAAPVRAVLRGL